MMLENFSIGGIPIVDNNNALLTIHDKVAIIEIELQKELAEWLKNQLLEIKNKPSSFGTFKNAFDQEFNSFDTFWLSEEVKDLRENKSKRS